MAAVFDTPAYKNQVASKVNVLASAARAGVPSLAITGKLHDYPWTGSTADEVLSTLIQPGSHENNRPIRPGMEDDRTFASMGVLDAAKHINSAEKFKVTARLGHVVIAILNRSPFWAHGHDAVQQMLAGFWRQVDVYKPSTEFYSRASTVAKKFKALAPYLAAVANTDKNIAAAMISWSLCRYARQLGCFSSSLCCRDGAYLPAWAK